MATYLELIIHAPEPLGELLIAELGAIGFESFTEEPPLLKAYIQQQDYMPEMWTEVATRYGISPVPIPTEVPDENWNEVWESQLEPAEISDSIRVIAPFHEKRGVPFEIIISPRMSFGTGHHATTAMLLQLLSRMDLSGKTVLDAGTGTGVLAVMAAKRGASYLEAFDIDPNCTDNALENAALNGVNGLICHTGSWTDFTLGRETYDVVIANINRNTLTEFIPFISGKIQKDGSLLCSGFYEDDAPVVESVAKAAYFSVSEKVSKEHWNVIHFVKE